jgi:quinoprotein glucose dehydrogenase
MSDSRRFLLIKRLVCLLYSNRARGFRVEQAETPNFDKDATPMTGDSPVNTPESEDSIHSSDAEHPENEARRGRPLLRLILAAAVVLGGYLLFSHYYVPPLDIDYDGPTASWLRYGMDDAGTRFSPANQITPDNVEWLRPAWEYRTGEDYTGTRFAGQAAFEATPILVGATLYLITPSTRVIALDAETGAERWVFDPQVDFSGSRSEMTSRGVSAWLDPQGDGTETGARIFFGTADARLIGLDAVTGRPIPDFGRNGEVDLKEGIGKVNPRNYTVTSPPAILGDTVIVGSAIGDNGAVDLERGAVRAYDARTGEMRWLWDPIPRTPDDPGYEEWSPEAAAKTGAANAWSIMSVDAERGLVFIPTGSASPDYYGGERPGSNLYANCVVALRAETGEVVWHFQVVHHDLWDYDAPAQPVLIDIDKDGETIPAVVQATKMGHVFFLHRETGEPIYPVEERPVPESDVPGEQAWPTQPYPVVTPALVPQTLTPDDAWGLTPFDRRAARKRIESLRSDGLFTPPSLQGSIHYPGVAGGVNWGSVAYDRATGLTVMNTSRVPFVITLFPGEEFDERRAAGGGEYARQRGTPYGMKREPLISGLGLPMNPPPWGTLAAVDARSGGIAWESTLGTVRDLIPGPMPWGPKWGTPNMGGPIVTGSGLVFISATMDYYLRAFDLKTGKEIWKGRLPAGGQATPMTYRIRPDSKQYVVICAGGHGRIGTKLGDYVIAYTLPQE